MTRELGRDRGVGVMTEPGEDDRAAVDRAFAELVAGFHLTADRPPLEQPAERLADADAPASLPALEPEGAGEPDPHWADNHPLFHLPVQPPPAPAPPPAVEHYVPDPMPPLGRPAVPALLGWLGIGWAVLVVLAAAFGARFPAWVGWVAVVGFLAGFAVLIARLPRSRPPDAGDGAVL
ncbi:hypothetical protein [uncultured Friedmanniella sp.]|uniref:hypothetical protein n=1 Tax=uncultured Friedmanniella sp. TaxID=335381 RepID=UPI0035CAFC41